MVETKRQIMTLDRTRFIMVEGLKLIEIRNKVSLDCTRCMESLKLVKKKDKVSLDCTRSGVTLETEARHHCLKETSLTKRRSRRRWRTLM